VVSAAAGGRRRAPGRLIYVGDGGPVGVVASLFEPTPQRPGAGAGGAGAAGLGQRADGLQQQHLPTGRQLPLAALSSACGGLGWVIVGYLTALVIAALLLVPRFGVHVEPFGRQARAAGLDGVRGVP